LLRVPCEFCLRRPDWENYTLWNRSGLSGYFSLLKEFFV
jgi:hypothetical protein